MGMAMPLGEPLKKNTVYSVTHFCGLELALDRDIRRQVYQAELVLTDKDGYSGVVTKVEVNPVEAALFRDRENCFQLRRRHLASLANEIHMQGIRIEDNSQLARRLTDAKEHINFLENVLYGILKVDPLKVEGMRKIRE